MIVDRACPAWDGELTSVRYHEDTAHREQRNAHWR
jgi:hypothetical protein